MTTVQAYHDQVWNESWDGGTNNNGDNQQSATAHNLRRNGSRRAEYNTLEQYGTNSESFRAFFNAGNPEAAEDDNNNTTDEAKNKKLLEEDTNYDFHVNIANTDDADLLAKLSAMLNFYKYEKEKNKLEKTMHTCVSEVFQSFPTLQSIQENRQTILVKFQMSFNLYVEYKKYKQDRNKYLLYVKNIPGGWITQFPVDEYGYKDHATFLLFFKQEPCR